MYFMKDKQAEPIPTGLKRWPLKHLAKATCAGDGETQVVLAVLVVKGIVKEYVFVMLMPSHSHGVLIIEFAPSGSRFFPLTRDPILKRVSLLDAAVSL